MSIEQSTRDDLASRYLDQLLFDPYPMQMCRLCSGFAKNLRMLRQLARQHDDALEQELAESDTRLSPEARDRIHRALGPTDG